MRKLIALSFVIFLVMSISVKAEVKTDREIYKPGEKVNIELSYSEPLNKVELTILKPIGDMEVSKITMINITPNRWGYNHTLKTNALNGTYVINIKAFRGGTLINASNPVIEFNKSFQVLAWYVNANLNKYFLFPSDTLNLTVVIKDKYSDNLRFDVFYNIKDSLNNEVYRNNLTITELNQGFVDAYQLSSNYTIGASMINLVFIDSDKRTFTLNLTFYVSEALSILPKIINETTRGMIEKTITFENFGDSDISIKEINFSKNLEGIASIVQRPYLIPPKDKASMRISLNTTNLAGGPLKGMINIYSDGTLNPIYVNLDIISPTQKEETIPENYSYIIWYFAIGVVAVIIVLALLKRKKKKEKKKMEAKKPEEKKKEEIYYKPQEEYRTEYY